MDNLGFLLHHLSFILDKNSDQVLQERLGIGFSQYKILLALQAGKISRQRDVADYLAQTEASVSRQINLLIKRALARTSRNPKSRREHLVALTAKGVRLLQNCTKVLNEYHAPMFELLPPRQREKLANYLLTMHDHACVSPNCPLR